MNPLFRIDFSISDSLKIVRKSVLIYETIIFFRFHQVIDNPPLTDIAPDQPILILRRNIRIKIFSFPSIRLADLGCRDKSAVGINDLDYLQDIFVSR